MEGGLEKDVDGREERDVGEGMRWKMVREMHERGGNMHFRDAEEILDRKHQGLRIQLND